jgi:hypothetical protein
MSLTATSGAFTGDLLTVDTAASASSGFNLLVLSSSEGPRFRVSDSRCGFGEGL